MDSVTHEQWNRMTDAQRADVMKSRLPKEPTPSAAIVREAPKPVTGVGGLEFTDFGDVLLLRAPVSATLPTADVQRIRGEARAEVMAAVARAVEADADLKPVVARLAALREREQSTREEHAGAGKDVDAAAAAARQALSKGDDPSAMEARRDQASAVRDRLGARLGELAELIGKAEDEEFKARQAANTRARAALHAEWVAKWQAAVRPLVKSLEEQARALVEVQSAILSL